MAINIAAHVWHTEWPQGMMRGQWSLSLKLSKHTMQGVVITANNGTSSAFFGIEKPPQEPLAYAQYVALYAAGSGGQGGGGSKAAAAAAAAAGRLGAMLWQGCRAWERHRASFRVRASKSKNVTLFYSVTVAVLELQLRT